MVSCSMRGPSPAFAAAQAQVTAPVIFAGRSMYIFAADHAASRPSSKATQIPAWGSCLW